jgi:hypothetical protein
VKGLARDILAAFEIKASPFGKYESIDTSQIVWLIFAAFSTKS